MSSDSNQVQLDKLQPYSKEKPDLGLEASVLGNFLQASFKPIFDFNTGMVFGFEGLAPIELTRAANLSSALLEGEYFSWHNVIESYAKQGLFGKILLNASLDVLLQSEAEAGENIKHLAEFGLLPCQVVIKLSRSKRDIDGLLLKQASKHYRGMGFQIALCNFNQEFAALALWTEIKPEYVLLDKAFIGGICHDKVKLKIASSIKEVASHSGAAVIAEGINNHLDLIALRDFGIQFGHGNYLAEPAIKPIKSLPQDLIKSLLRVEYPRESMLQTTATVAKLLTFVPPVSPSTTIAEVLDLFELYQELYSIPVVQDEKPLGLISRMRMIDNYVRPFRRELHGDKPCETVMDTDSIIIEHDSSLQELSELILNSNPRHLSSGFIVSKSGKYLGLGSGHALLRLITNMQINAARYANPLTLLPGNLPICEHIDLMIQSESTFIVCYFDIDHFKPFNDVYGFQKGDEVIKLTALLLTKVCGLYDFIGHIGGDDFIVLFQSTDWEQRCQDFLSDVAERFQHMYSEQDRLRGGIEIEDRQGINHFYPILTMSIASLQVSPGMFKSHHQVSEACTSAKKQAKKFNGNSLFIERRLPFVPNPITKNDKPN